MCHCIRLNSGLKNKEEETETVVRYSVFKVWLSTQARDWPFQFNSSFKQGFSAWFTALEKVKWIKTKEGYRLIRKSTQSTTLNKTTAISLMVSCLQDLNKEQILIRFWQPNNLEVLDTVLLYKTIHWRIGSSLLPFLSIVLQLHEQLERICSSFCLQTKGKSHVKTSDIIVFPSPSCEVRRSAWQYSSQWKPQVWSLLCPVSLSVIRCLLQDL